MQETRLDVGFRRIFSKISSQNLPDKADLYSCFFLANESFIFAFKVIHDLFKIEIDEENISPWKLYNLPGHH